jgi:hypothetical protein
LLIESPNPYFDRFTEEILDLEDLDPALLIGIEGSLGEERKSRVSRNLNSDYRLYVKLQKSYTYQLSSINPKNFYNSLAEVTTSYPHLPGVGDFQIFGLSVFEGKGGSKKWRNLLTFLAYKPDDFFYISEIVISKIISRLRPQRQLSGSWLELRELLYVFGHRDTRLEYLQLRYGKRALGNMRKDGEAIARSLSISLVKNVLVKPVQRKLGYNDKGSTAEQQENHGDKEKYDYRVDSEGNRLLRIYHYKPAKFEYKNLRTKLQITNFKYPERPPRIRMVPSGQKVVSRFIPSEFDFETFEEIKEEDLMNNDKDLNQLLVEIFKNATLNYLAWLEKETNPSQETDEADKATNPQQ